MRRRLAVTATCVSWVMAIITIAWPMWIESVFGSDPDHHSGLLEVLIVVVLVAAAVTSSLAARMRYAATRSRS